MFLTIYSKIQINQKKKKLEKMTWRMELPAELSIILAVKGRILWLAG